MITIFFVHKCTIGMLCFQNLLPIMNVLFQFFKFCNETCREIIITVRELDVLSYLRSPQLLLFRYIFVNSCHMPYKNLILNSAILTNFRRWRRNFVAENLVQNSFQKKVSLLFSKSGLNYGITAYHQKEDNLKKKNLFFCLKYISWFFFSQFLWKTFCIFGDHWRTISWPFPEYSWRFRNFFNKKFTTSEPELLKMAFSRKKSRQIGMIGHDGHQGKIHLMQSIRISFIEKNK